MKALRLSLTLLAVLISGLYTTSYATSVRASTFGWDATDATTALQQALDAVVDTVIVDKQAGDWIVKPLFCHRSNQTVLFEPGVIVTAMKGEFKGTNDCLFVIESHANVSLIGYGATFRMQKADYMDATLYTKAEWRSCIAIYGGADVSIIGLTLKESGGDGIYVGYTSRNVLVKDVVCDNNYRQGISVVDVENLLIENCFIKNTAGTAPQSGIDFEPDEQGNKIVNCVVKNCRFENNWAADIVIAVHSLDSLSADVSIIIENCYMNASSNGIQVFGARDNGPGGLIEVKNCFIENQRLAGIEVGSSAFNMKTRFTNCVLSNNATLKYDSSSIVLDDRELSYPHYGISEYGGIEFVDCFVYDTSAAHPYFISTREVSGSIGCANVKGNLTVLNPHGVQYDLGAKAHDIALNITPLTSDFATTITITTPDSEAIKSTGNTGLIQVSRSSGRTSVPFPVLYTSGGSAAGGWDYSFMPGCIVIGAGLTSAVDTVVPLKNGMTAGDTRDVLTIAGNVLYTAGSANNTAVNILVNPPVKVMERGVPRTELPGESPMQGIIVESASFKSSVSIRFAGKLKAGSTIQLYDSKGERIVDLTNRFRNSRVIWNTSGRAAGVYFIKLRNNGMEINQKLITAR